MAEPMLLLDQPDDGYCEERGWVQATVSADEARALLQPFCFDDAGMDNAKPVGEAKRVWLACDDPAGLDGRWFPCEPDAAGAVEFWEFDATDTAPSLTEDQ